MDLDDDRDAFNSFEIPQDTEKEEAKEIEEERGDAPPADKLLDNLQMHMFAGVDQDEEQRLLTWSEMQPPHRQKSKL